MPYEPRESESKRIALVTGGNRGIGFAAAYLLGRRNIHVLIGCRNADRGRRATHHLGRLGVAAAVIDIEADKPDSCKLCVDEILRRYGYIDILINNAGAFLDAGPALDADPRTIIESFRTNALGPAVLMQLVARPMMERGYGRIVNVSSGMGSIRPGAKGAVGYRASKAALNMLTTIFAQEMRGTNVLVNAACPGWVRTRITIGAATRPADGADTVVYLATLAHGGPTGQLFRNRVSVPW